MGFFDTNGAQVDPKVDRSSEVYGWSSAMLVLATFAVILRVMARHSAAFPCRWDDWTIVLALPFGLATCVLPIISTRFYNMGHHIATSSDDQIRGFFLLTWLYELCYMIALGATKFSMIFLYWRIFPMSTYKIPLYALGFVTMGMTIGSIFAVIFTCRPISGAWDTDLKPQCFDSLHLYIGQGATNISIDIALFILPVFMVSRLHMRLSQKIAVSAVFLLGIFVTLCSVLRLQQLIQTSHNAVSDPTLDLIPAGIWSTVEVNLSIVTACLPALYILIHRFRDRGDIAHIREYDAQVLGHITVRDEIEIETHPRGSWDDDVRLGMPPLAYHPGGINSSEVSVEKDLWSSRKVSVESGERR